MVHARNVCHILLMLSQLYLISEKGSVISFKKM
jgi:hypothetical protein